jgi:methanethiol S-methyltransferase
MTAAEAAVPFSARAFAWAGALCFFGSLSFFLFSYEITYGETAPATANRATAIAINSALFTIFALHHSVFARQRVRSWITRLVSSRLERSLYVWVASLLFIVVCLVWQPVPGIAWHASGPLRWLLVVIQAAGIWLTLWSAAALDILELSGVRQVTSKPRETEFKTSGPYGWMRHPIYTGWFVMLFCVPMMTMTRLVFAVVSCGYLLAAIPFEERSLLASSNGAYGRYSRQVRWKLVPGIY